MSIQSTFINTGVNVHITVNSIDEKLCLENMWKILFVTHLRTLTFTSLRDHNLVLCK